MCKGEGGGGVEEVCRWEVSCHIVWSNFNGLNTFGTIKICSRQWQFGPMRVD